MVEVVVPFCGLGLGLWAARALRKHRGYAQKLNETGKKKNVKITQAVKIKIIIIV